MALLPIWSKISLSLVLVQSKAPWVNYVNNIGSPLENAEIYPFTFGIAENLGKGKRTDPTFA